MRIAFDFNHVMSEYVQSAYESIAAELNACLAEGLPEKSAADARNKLHKLGVSSEVIASRFVTSKELADLLPRLRASHKNVEAMRGDERKMMAWTRLPYEQEKTVSDIKMAAGRIRERFSTFVVFGIGGSALGPTAVQTALNHLRWNDLPESKRHGPKLYVEDNVDPERMSSLLDVIELGSTCFNIVSKSGNTSETMSQYLMVVSLLKKHFPDDWHERIIFTTDAARGNLQAIARGEAAKGRTITCFTVPDGVGGRFSELCPVGLLAAAVCGINIEEILAGAQLMDTWCREDDPMRNPALLAAGIMYILSELKSPKKNISVMFPYADSLRFIADWYAQLWAESLGKDHAQNGDWKDEPAGQTPVKAVGVTDQHSQVQLYTEGPFDKVVTFLSVKEYRSTLGIPGGAIDYPDVAFLSGSTFDTLIQKEREATEYALMVSGKPSWNITLPEVNANTVGQLLFFFEMMTAYEGDLLGIDAFDQPGVEEGKNATYGLFGRKGFEYKARELSARPAKSKEFML